MPDPFSPDTHPWLSALRSALPPFEDGLHPSPTGAKDRIHAAVALILRAGPNPETLLIRRAEADGDPWSGHMALPGGRRDSSDRDLLQTAMRETLEETGVRLEDAGRPLGRLEPLVPTTYRLPPMSIHPFVFGVSAETRAHTASREVAEILWTPISALRCPEAAGTVDIHLGEVTRAFPCIRVEERVVWGLTYRILTDFFRFL